MAKRAKATTNFVEDSVRDARLTGASTRVGKKGKKSNKDQVITAKVDSEEAGESVQEKSVNKSSSKKRKVPVDENPDQDTRALPRVAGPAPKKQKPKQKKSPKQFDDDDALFDLDLGINTIFGRMDPDLLADYVAACTKRFGSDLSPIELNDLYLPAAAIRDTTTFADTRVKEKLPDFLESCVAGESEIEQKRLGSAPKEMGAPHTIVVAGAGLRAADLVRAARKFQKKDSLVAKLVSCS